MEDLLNGGYRGLFGEVVTCDVYQLRDLKFKPNVFFDLGANVGITTRFAHELWPNCYITAVEPDADNFQNLVNFTPYDNIRFVNAAIGRGRMRRFKDALNGAHEMYINEGVGYPADEIHTDPRIIDADVETIMLDELVKQYWMEGSVLKLDIEGNEMEIFAHEDSMKAMRLFDYICGETHPFALHGGLLPAVKQITQDALMSLSDTHEVRIHGTSFWITKQ